VPDAMQRGAKWSGASLIRDRHRLERSRVCSAPLCAALRPGHERARTNLWVYKTMSDEGSLFPACYLQGAVQLQGVAGIRESKSGADDFRGPGSPPAARGRPG
jgi:hypothetical protein